MAHKMPLNPDVDEGQLMETGYPPGFRTRDPEPNQQDQALSDNNMQQMDSSARESYQSRGEKTQLIDLEIDTQAMHQASNQGTHQDSFASRVDDTQFLTLELDTQVATQPAEDIRRIRGAAKQAESFDEFVNYESYAEQQSTTVADINCSKPPLAESSASAPRFERPITHNPQDLAFDFKFASAKNPIQTPVRVTASHSHPALIGKQQRPHTNLPATSGHIDVDVTTKLQDTDSSSCQPAPSVTVTAQDQEYIRAPMDALRAELPPVATRTSPLTLPYTGHADRNATKLQSSARSAKNLIEPKPYNLETVPPLITSSLSRSHDASLIGRTSSSTTGADNAVPDLKELPHRCHDEFVHPPPTTTQNAGPDSRIPREWPVQVEIVEHSTTLREPLTPLREKQNGRPLRVLSKGRRSSVNNARVPFPEAAAPQSRRRHPLQDSNENHHHYNKSEPQVSLGQNAVASNSGRAREPGRDESQGSSFQARPSPLYKPDTPHSRKDLRQGSICTEEIVHNDLFEQKNASPELPARDISTHTAALALSPVNHPQQLSAHNQLPGDNGGTAHPHAPSSMGINQDYSDHSECTLADTDARASSEELNVDSQCEQEYSPDPVNTDQIQDHPDSVSTLEGQGAFGAHENQDEPEAHASESLPRAHSIARPESRRSNQGKTRGGFSGEPAPQRNHRIFGPQSDTSKITKLSNRQLSVKNAARSRSPAPQAGPMLAGYQKFLKTGEQYAEAVDGFEQQRIIIESQHLDILKLQYENDSSRQKFEALEAEKETLKQKVQRIAEISSKYKSHMNDVVRSQKYLNAQAAIIRKSESAAQLAIKTKIEAIQLEIKATVKEVKDQGCNVEDLAKKLSLAFYEKRKLAEEKAKIEREKDTLQTLVDTEKKTNGTLRVELERLHLDLSRETHSKNQLGDLLQSQSTVYKELVGQLNQLPGVFSDRLQQEGVLASILSAESATHAKIDTVTSRISALISDKLEPPDTLAKLIEHSFSRLENREKDSKAGHLSFLEANSKALEGLRESLGQLRLDKDSEVRYIGRIANLERSKETLVSDKIAREQEIQILIQQLKELRRDQEDLRSQLSSRTEELAAAHTAPQEDPRLEVKIQELESAKTALAGQLEAASQEASKAKDETCSLQRFAQLKEQQAKELEERLSDAQGKIKGFGEKQSRYIAAKEHEIKVVCQDLTKKAEIQKATMKLKLESEVKNIEQKYKEKDAELSLAKQEIQRLQAEHDASADVSANLQHDDSQFLEKASKLVAQMKQMKVQNRKFSDELFRSVWTVKNESAEIQKMVQTAMNEPGQVIEAAVRKQRDIEAKIRGASLAEMEIDSLKEQKGLLQTKVKSLSETVARHNQLALAGPDKVLPSANMTPVMLPPAQDVLQRTGSKFFLRSEGYRIHGESQETSRNGASSGVGTPEETLRQQLRMTDSRSMFKPGGIAQSSAARNASAATPQIHGSRHQNLVEYASASHASARAQVSILQNSTEHIKPFSEMTPSSQTSASSLTDLDSLMDRIFAEDDHGLGSNDETSADRTSGDQPQEKIVRHNLGMKTPNEASMKPLKSAMKRPTATQSNAPSVNTLNNALAGLRNFDVAHKTLRHERRPESFVGAVSGGRIGSISVASSSLLQTSEKKRLPEDQSLLIAEDNSSQKKRSSSNGSDATEPAQKRRLASRKPSRSIIPDSQGV
ncbi:hypothetical protein JHW43_002530 [Diplocarpon mali]|nr:hypothetical protein JHW43_002530 [Diplocarpon mali]